MELRHLRYFLAVADQKNFTRAAEQSFVAQSALSQQVSRLEKELGTRLFVRTSHSVELTPAGELLLPHARRIVADAARAQAEMRSHLGLEKGHLNLGLIQTSASPIDVVRPISRFHDAHPEIEISIVNQPSTEMVDGLQHGLLDVAVVGVSPDELPEGLEARLLATDPLVAVIDADVSRKLVGPLTLRQALKFGPLINFAPGTGIRLHVDEALKRAGIEPSSVFEMSQVTDMVRFAAMGLGVAIVPHALTIHAAADAADVEGDYCVFELRDPLAVHPVSVVFDPARISAAGRRFLDFLDGLDGWDPSNDK